MCVAVRGVCHVRVTSVMWTQADCCRLVHSLMYVHILSHKEPVSQAGVRNIDTSSLSAPSPQRRRWYRRWWADSNPHPPGLSFSNHEVLAEHCRCLARLYLKRWRPTFFFKSVSIYHGHGGPGRRYFPCPHARLPSWRHWCVFKAQIRLCCKIK